ncbi:hypothetical protein D3C78_1622090 [compost metagenome]
MLLEPFRQHQLFAKMIPLLIPIEARCIRRDFEQKAAFLTEIDRVKILTVNNWRWLITIARHMTSPQLMISFILCSPCNMVNSACTPMTERYR